MSRRVHRPSVVRLLALVLGSILLSLPLMWAGTSGSARGQDRDGEATEAEASILAGDEELGGEDADASSSVRREGGGKVKVFRFSGLDLAGRLKSPQLLHFLNRLRAEFDRPRLPHRSFIPELQRSTKTKSF